MRTKIILLAAAVLAAGLGVSLAQAPVYSVNAVGYVTVTVTNNGYTLIANPLNITASNNLLSAIVPVATPDDYILRWDALNQTFGDPSQYIDSSTGWLPDVSINPGEGFFYFHTVGAGTPSPATAGNTNLTFVGEVPQGSLTNRLTGAGKYSLISHIVPQQVPLDAPSVGFPALVDDFALLFITGAQSYSDPYIVLDNANSWTEAPSPKVGEGFFYHSETTSPSRDWTRTFSVN